MELTWQMKVGICDHPDVEILMMELVQELGSVTGKRSYGYLPKKLKPLVERIVDEMERIPSVSDCYHHWLELQNQVDSYYDGDERKRLPLSRQKEFCAVKNAVIQEAERIRRGEITFEDAGMEQRDEPEDGLQAGNSLWRIVDNVYDDTLPLAERDEAVEDLISWAEYGDATAQYFLGKLYRDGGLLIPDAKLAADWFYKAACQSVIVAQYALGKLFLSDNLLVQDTKLGTEWLEYAAQNGSHYAAYRVGKECLRGKVVKKDVLRAVEYFESAAHAGNQYAQFFLDRADSFQPPSVMLAATRLLHHMANSFRDNSLPKTGTGGVQIDRKRLQKLR